FFTLTGLEAGLARIDGDEAEIIVLLDRATSELSSCSNSPRAAMGRRARSGWREPEGQEVRDG
ncbi:hypothetical protein QCE73_26550, partial [Caballeronia sp. LZ029]|uniref:hypothetical protein n=1 Tax=Caballeronia sp. LZ029 TaxID=3038564 RepID=UPI002864FDF0